MLTSISGVLAVICAAGLSAQTRLNEKDVLQHMKNLKDDAKKLRPSFNSGLAKSTTPENDAGEGGEDAGAFREVDKFQVRSVQESTQAQPYLQICFDMARQIDKIMTSTPQDPAPIRSGRRRPNSIPSQTPLTCPGVMGYC
jgi:hypothetical protein